MFQAEARTQTQEKKKKKLQNIINLLSISQHNFIINEKNKNALNNEKNINNQYSFKTDIIHNFQKNFENITPYVNTVDHNSSDRANALKKNTDNYHIFYKTPIFYDRDNFYLSDIITKASITMGKCSVNSESFKNPNF